jgi:hypothetical protein
MERQGARAREITALEAWVRHSIFHSMANLAELRRELFNMVESTLKFQSGPIFHLPISEELYHLSQYAKAISFGGPPLDPATRVDNMAFDIAAQILAGSRRKESGNLYDFSPVKIVTYPYCDSAKLINTSSFSCKLCGETGFKSMEHVVYHAATEHPDEYFKTFGNGARSPTPWRILNVFTKQVLMGAKIKSAPLNDAQLGLKENGQVFAKTDIAPGASTRRAIGALESRTLLDKIEAVALHHELIERNTHMADLLARKILPVSAGWAVDLGDIYSYSVASFVTETSDPERANAAIIAHNIGYKPGSPILTLIFFRNIKKGSEVRALHLSNTVSSPASLICIPPTSVSQLTHTFREGPPNLKEPNVQHIDRSNAMSSDSVSNKKRQDDLLLISQPNEHSVQQEQDSRSRDRSSRQEQDVRPGNRSEHPQPVPRSLSHTERPQPELRSLDRAERPQPELRSLDRAERPQPELRSLGHAERPRPDLRSREHSKQFQPDSQSREHSNQPQPASRSLARTEKPEPDSRSRDRAERSKPDSRSRDRAERTNPDARSREHHKRLRPDSRSHDNKQQENRGKRSPDQKGLQQQGQHSPYSRDTHRLDPVKPDPNDWQSRSQPVSGDASTRDRRRPESRSRSRSRRRRDSSPRRGEERSNVHPAPEPADYKAAIEVTTKEVDWTSREEIIRIGDKYYDYVEDFSNLYSDEENSEVSESDIPNTVDGRRQLQNLLKEKAAKNPGINGNQIFPPVADDFYPKAIETPSVDSLPMKREHALLTHAYDRGSFVPPGSEDEREHAASFVETHKESILKWIINVQPSDFIHEDSGRSAKKTDSNVYACPGCAQYFLKTSELIAHIVTTLEHQSVCNEEHPAFFFHLGICSLPVGNLNYYLINKKLQYDIPCNYCAVGQTALDGYGKGTHELLNPGAFAHLSEGCNLLKLFYAKRGYAPSFITLFKSLDKDNAITWTSKLAVWAVARLYRKAFILPSANRKNNFENCYILSQELLNRRTVANERLDHSHTKTIGDNYSFFKRWNERDDLSHFRENNILRCVDALLNPAKKVKKAKRR